MLTKGMGLCMFETAPGFHCQKITGAKNERVLYIQILSDSQIIAI